MAAAKGVWLDTKTGKVVSAQPEEGIQLISPDAEPTDADTAYVEKVKAALAGETEVETVTTKSVTKK